MYVAEMLEEVFLGGSEFVTDFLGLSFSFFSSSMSSESSFSDSPESDFLSSEKKSRKYNIVV